MMPSVDVIIPTLNSERTLSRCLARIREQDYSGEVRVLVIDGGSIDRTVPIARSAGVNVEVRPGLYVSGKSGARNLGERLTNADLVWLIDSDNYIVERSALTELARPLSLSDKIMLSIPEIVHLPSLPMISRWLAHRERRELQRLRSRGFSRDGYVEVEDVDFGISNASLIRRSALEKVGGYDSDVRLLVRLRRNHLSRGALVSGAHYIHDTADGVLDYRRKWVRRILRFSNMSQVELTDYFVEYPFPSDQHELLSRSMFNDALAEPMQDVVQFLETRDPIWLFGLVHSLIGASIILRRPLTYRRFLSGFF